MMTAAQIIEEIKASPLTGEESGQIMAALLKKTFAESLMGAAMDILLKEEEGKDGRREA